MAHGRHDGPEPAGASHARSNVTTTSSDLDIAWQAPRVTKRAAAADAYVVTVSVHAPPDGRRVDTTTDRRCT